MLEQGPAESYNGVLILPLNRPLLVVCSDGDELEVVDFEVYPPRVVYACWASPLHHKSSGLRFRCIKIDSIDHSVSPLQTMAGQRVGHSPWSH